MAELGKVFEREDLGGGRFRETISPRPIAYLESGIYRRINSDFVDSGIQSRPHIVTAAPMWLSVGDGGTRRIHPTRESDVYFEIGRPYRTDTRQPFPLNPLTRVGNLLTSTNATTNVYITMAGHFAKVGIWLKNGWLPPNNQFAFPVSLSGLTFNAGVLSKSGVPVMRLSKPVVYDLSNPIDERPITWELARLAGQDYVIFTLPSLVGMSRPLVDPTFTTQPDGTAGLDTFIVSTLPNNNFGTNVLLAVGNGGGATYRSFLEVDMSSIPPSALISSTTLSLRRNGGNGVGTRTVDIYRQKRAWVEAQATYNIYSTSNNWQTAGGFGSDDCEQVSIGSLSQTDTDTGFQNWSLTGTSVADLDLGNGWLAKTTVETALVELYYDSSDSGTAANRPKVVVVYTEPGGMLAQLMQYGQYSGGTL